MFFFGGSRSLPRSGFSFVTRVVSSVLQSGSCVHVGCCSGADAAVVSAARRSPARLRVFSAFASSGAGSCPVSAVSAVRSAAASGVHVSWLAGGPLSLPLRARLIRRSLAALAGCSAAVFFLPGSGSLSVAAHAVRSSIPVFVFQRACPSAPPRGCIGSWVRASFSGFSCWHWFSL